MQVVTYLHHRFHDRHPEGQLPTPADLQSAFDKALMLVRRSIASGMKASDGTSARPKLKQLEGELKDQRATALERGSVDRDWLQKTVRWVVEWVPDDELKLVAALGQIARAVPPA
jgi:hypothetical protein